MEHNTNEQAVSLKGNSQGTWVAQSVKCLTSAHIMISQFISLSPTSGVVLCCAVLTAGSLEPASDSGPPSLSTPHFPPPSKIHKTLKIIMNGCLGGSVSLSVRLWLRSWSCSPWVWAPHRALLLTAQSLEPASDSASPAPPPFTLCLCLSLSKVNKH